MTVENRTRQIREKKKLNQEDVALGTGLTKETISRYERGDRCPSLEMALRMAAYLEVGLEDLFNLDPASIVVIKNSLKQGETNPDLLLQNL